MIDLSKLRTKKTRLQKATGHVVRVKYNPVDNPEGKELAKRVHTVEITKENLEALYQEIEDLKEKINDRENLLYNYRNDLEYFIDAFENLKKISK